MKYLKLFDSLFIDNQERVSNYISSFENRRKELRDQIDGLNQELHNIQADIKKEIATVDEEYLDEIKSYMVDVEDFDCKYKFNPLHTRSEAMCTFTYTFGYDSFQIFQDLIHKLEDILTKKAFSTSYHTDKGSISVDNIHKTKPNIIKISITFRRISTLNRVY